MPLPSGQLINNRYRILRLLGQGGMGAVYLAEDGNLPGKQVAIKENLDFSQAAQDQFKREAVILARLKHPSLPQVTDHFVLPSGAQYLVMEYVDGEDLDQTLARRGPLPEAEVLGWMGQVLDALEYMHTWVDPATGQVTPVVHRDIKPGNIKRTPQGRIMLVDFGIAKYQQAGGTLTGARAASPGFSPLEQYTGGTDVRSDVYSLGATLYCLLTGQIPPEAPDLAAGRTLLPPPRAVAPAVSGNTETVILRAMQLPVTGRYQSVADLRLALTPGGWQACPACGATNRTGARFCHTCGAALVLPSNAFGAWFQRIWRSGRGTQIALVATVAVVLLATGALASRLSMRPASGEPTSTRVAVVASMTDVPTITRASITTTRTATLTASVTPLATRTTSRTPPPLPSRTATRTATLTASVTPSATPTQTRTPSVTPSVTPTVFWTPTPSLTRTATRTATLTASVTPTATRTASRTPTPSPTRTATRTATSTASVTPTATPTASRTPTPPPAAGATAVSSVDGMILLYVPAGEFLMGSADSDSRALGEEKPQHTVYLDAYWIDRTEVTKAQYQQCVAAGKCAAPICSGTGQANHTVVCVSWQDSANYCAWTERRLPTEAEWEKAARGTDGRLYPWGNEEWECRRAEGCVGGTSAVGSYPAGVSPYGALDMAGNEWEWVADWYDEKYYASSPAQNPTGPDSGRYRVLRGGSWDYERRFARAAFRNWFVPENTYDFLGFRCVRSD